MKKVDTLYRVPTFLSSREIILSWEIKKETTNGV